MWAAAPAGAAGARGALGCCGDTNPVVSEVEQTCLTHSKGKEQPWVWAKWAKANVSFMARFQIAALKSASCPSYGISSSTVGPPLGCQNLG